MAVNFFVNIFNASHCTVFYTADHGPAVIFSGGASGLTAGGEILGILLMDICLGVGILLTLAHHLFCEIGRYIQIDGQIGAGQTQFVVFKIIQPV